MRNSSDDRRSIAGEIAGHWRKWIGNRKGAAELESIGSSNELGQITHDGGIRPNTLNTLTGKWPEAPQLLPLRMIALNLDFDEITKLEPAGSNELRKLCWACETKRTCEHDLTHDPANPAWRDYCPNSTTLTVFGAQRASQSIKDGGRKWRRPIASLSV